MRRISASAVSRFLLMIGFGTVALFLGTAGALFGAFGQVFLLSVTIPLAGLLISYRVGLLALIILVPFANAQFLPKAGPLSIVNIALLGVCTVFVVQTLMNHILGKKLVLPYPKKVLLYFVLPVTLGFVVGTFHLSDIPQYVVDRNDGKIGGLNYYWITLYLKNFLLVFAAYIAAVSVAEYNDARRYVIACLLSGVVLVFAGVGLFALSGASLEAGVRSRQMFSPLGLHANDMAGMLLPVLGASLFMSDAVSGAMRKMAMLFIASVLIVGVVLTGSRAGFLGLIVVLAYYLWRNRKAGLALLFLLIVAVGLLFMPEAIVERLTMGIEKLGDSSGTQSVTDSGNEISNGRFYIYSMLLPDILSSPIFGNGIKSTLWSAHVRAGNMVGHPHNLYLSILLDLGIAGLAAILLFFVYVWRTFVGLTSESTLSPGMRAYFAGSAAGFLGYLTRGLGGGEIYPSMDLWFFFISLGLAVGIRHRLLAGRASAVTELRNQAEDSPLRPSRLRPASGFWR